MFNYYKRFIQKTRPERPYIIKEVSNVSHTFINIIVLDFQILPMRFKLFKNVDILIHFQKLVTINYARF